MEIRDITTEYTVTFEPRVISVFGESYEVSDIVVRHFSDSDIFTASASGYKITKNGERSKSAPFPTQVFGPEVDGIKDEAVAAVKASR